MSKWESEHTDRRVDPHDAEHDDLVPTPWRSRMNTRRWCKGKVGVEHVLATRVSKWGTHASQFWPDQKPCFRAEWYVQRWICTHETYCTTCGKILRHTLDANCPDFTTEITRRRKKR